MYVPGALAWPFLSLAAASAGIIEAAFEELARRWKPILDAHEEEGVDVCFELHPGEDLFDGVTFERFLDKLKGHKRCCINYDPSHFRLQALDYVGFIDVYHERIKAFHVKDAEFRPSPKQGVYSGFSDWPDRAGASDRSATAMSTSAHFLEPFRLRLQQLGGARVGMRDQEPGRRRARGR